MPVCGALMEDKSLRFFGGGGFEEEEEEGGSGGGFSGAMTHYPSVLTQLLTYQEMKPLLSNTYPLAFNGSLASPGDPNGPNGFNGLMEPPVEASLTAMHLVARAFDSPHGGLMTKLLLDAGAGE